MSKADQLIKAIAITAHTDNSNGQEKVRFNVDFVSFTKRYNSSTAIRCDAIELPEAMTKLDAVRFAKSQPAFASASDQALLDEEIAKRETKASKAEKRVALTGKPAKAKVKVTTAEAVTE